MAFSETQKDQVRRFLGYPGGFRDSNYRLESMFDTIGSNAVEQASVEAILTELVAIDAAIGTGAASATASYGPLKKVDEVEFYDANSSNGSSDTVTALRRAKMLVERLRQRFGVELAGNYFGTIQMGDGSIALG
jgi:hypothetical protein